MARSSAYLLEDAECSLSDKLFNKWVGYMWSNICSNPCPEGRKLTELVWQESKNKRARKLIWC